MGLWNLRNSEIAIALTNFHFAEAISNQKGFHSRIFTGLGVNCVSMEAGSQQLHRNKASFYYTRNLLLRYVFFIE
ncbi:hypothetical protein Glove_329g18 [Diversispora epigaea]|uniref:Uncharacterized protein n=1 Tax=Diversispora epigaea TaxID=1348612 RepID=A0A397HSJ8_9GLOM|nr:hypothetical protein Glove_329g18 [Diversispora epigaea]